ncbi:hypothetical protein ACF0H5_000377 [Mactra antiquata]
MDSTTKVNVSSDLFVSNNKEAVWVFKDTAAWSTNVGNEFCQVLVSVFTDSERQGLDRMIQGELTGVDYLYSQTNQPIPLPLDLLDVDGNEAKTIFEASERGSSDDLDDEGFEDVLDVDDLTVPDLQNKPNESPSVIIALPNVPKSSCLSTISSMVDKGLRRMSVIVWWNILAVQAVISCPLTLGTFYCQPLKVPRKRLKHFRLVTKQRPQLMTW